MIYLDGTFRDGTNTVGPWTTDQEIEEMVRRSEGRDINSQGLRELRTVCREQLAQADANFRSPFTVT
jgi:hypothetical protein